MSDVVCYDVYECRVCEHIWEEIAFLSHYYKCPMCGAYSISCTFEARTEQEEVKDV